VFDLLLLVKKPEPVNIFVRISPALCQIESRLLGALKIRGILTPACALAQNDRSIGGFVTEWAAAPDD